VNDRKALTRVWWRTMFIVAVLLFVTAIIGTLVFIAPAAVVLLPWPAWWTLQTYRRVVDAVQTWWLTFAVALMERLAKVRISVSGDSPPAKRERGVILICNHNCRLDWMFLWCLSARFGWLSALTIMLKASLKKVPFFGWACQAFHFIFLSRNNRDGDLEVIRKVLEYLNALGSPTVVLVFPEGTDLHPDAVARSKVYAAQNGLPEWRHVLHPRTAGFIAAVRAFGSDLDAVYDVTISYTNHPDVVASDDPRPSEKAVFLSGRWPVGVHFHVERTVRAELMRAGEGDAALSKWLDTVWGAKERRLAAGGEQTASTSGRAPPTLTVALLGWAVAALGMGWGLARSSAVRLALLAACTVWILAMKICGGLGDLERHVHQARLTLKAKRA